MSFAEIILRIGASIGGWLVFIGFCLILAVLREAECDPASDELWRGTLFFGGLSGLSLLFVGRGLPWRDAIRWLSVPAIGLALYAGFGIAPAIGATSIDGGSLCVIASPTVSDARLAEFGASTLERAWPVCQLFVLAAGLFQAGRYWIAPMGGDAGR